MPLIGEYEPSTQKWVRDHVERYEGSGGTDGAEIDGLLTVLLTTRGARSGKIRKSPVMRVEHEGRYAVVASRGGSPKNPLWYYNLLAEPRVELRDATVLQDMVAHLATGDERATWWARAVATFPPYAEYQTKTERTIPVFVLEPVG